jgi:AAA+ superfamily predicted ATPase
MIPGFLQARNNWRAAFCTAFCVTLILSVASGRAEYATRPQESNLSQSQQSTLQEIAAAARARRPKKAPGIGVLFACGETRRRTEATERLAKELGRDVYRVDLSKIVSKYIGETEKNLRQVFATAAAHRSILFFDEADGLFGKRSEVKDSHDRFANSEINYLLQQIEKYDGIAIIAAKRKEHIDPAFLRRLRFVLEFQCGSKS